SANVNKVRCRRTTALMLVGVALAGRASAQARFVTVFQNPYELEADRLLARQLGSALVDAPEEQDYEAVIVNLIADQRRGSVRARVTPYALVVAEMRGAKLEPIATYRSRSTHRTVTETFLVVPKSLFPTARFPDGPTLEQVFDYVKSVSDKQQPAKFVFHNKLSTSSYFLPSLMFRTHNVFSADIRTASSEGVITLRVEHLD